MAIIILDGVSFDNSPKPAPAPNNQKPPTPPGAPNEARGGPGGCEGATGSPGIWGVSSARVPQNGAPGLRGGDAASANINANLYTIDPSDSGWFLARGGNGGPGGDASTPGGDGGDGGDGGPGWGLSRGGNGGDGGFGAVGARAGDGGAGGNGGTIYIRGTGAIPYNPANVAGGKGGAPGTGARVASAGPPEWVVPVPLDQARTAIRASTPELAMMETMAVGERAGRS